MKRYIFAIVPLIAFLPIAIFQATPNYKIFVKIIRFSEPSYGVFWHEPRFRLYQTAHYLPYPEMPPCDRLGFIYRLSPKRVENATK